MPCGVRRSEPCAASIDVVGWTVPDGAAHVPCHGYLGLYPRRVFFFNIMVHSSIVSSRKKIVWHADFTVQLDKVALYLQKIIYSYNNTWHVTWLGHITSQVANTFVLPYITKVFMTKYLVNKGILDIYQGSSFKVKSRCFLNLYSTSVKWYVDTYI